MHECDQWKLNRLTGELSIMIFINTLFILPIEVCCCQCYFFFLRDLTTCCACLRVWCHRVKSHRCVCVWGGGFGTVGIHKPRIPHNDTSLSQQLNRNPSFVQEAIEVEVKVETLWCTVGFTKGTNWKGLMPWLATFIFVIAYKEKTNPKC